MPNKFPRPKSKTPLLFCHWDFNIFLNFELGILSLLRCGAPSRSIPIHHVIYAHASEGFEMSSNEKWSKVNFIVDTFNE